jgi:hypothetical protein
MTRRPSRYDRIIDTGCVIIMAASIITMVIMAAVAAFE